MAMFAVPNFTYAQTPNPASNIEFDVLPQNPAPFETVTVNINSYTLDLDIVNISWSVNGRSITSGIGRKTFSTQVGDSGTETMIVAAVSLPTGVVEKRVALRPLTMVLLWQANDSYTPPFYKGKALPSSDSEIKVVAIPEVRSGSGLVSPKNMTYSWKKNYAIDQQASGYGKSYLTFTNDYLESTESVEVLAGTTDGRYSSRGRISIRTYEPKISFYSMTDIYGINFNKSIIGTHTIDGEDTIMAVPYFISPKNIQIPSIKFNWYLNDNLISVQEFRKHVVPLRAGTGQSGISKLTLDIENDGKIFQRINKEIFIEF